MRIANVPARRERALEHRERLASRARREDRDRSPGGRLTMQWLRERCVVHPTENDPRDRVPEREREQHEQDRLSDVAGAEPPVGETKHCGNADTCKGGNENAVSRADCGSLTVPPESRVAQRRSARRRAAATKVYVPVSPTVVNR